MKPATKIMSIFLIDALYISFVLASVLAAACHAQHGLSPLLPCPHSRCMPGLMTLTRPLQDLSMGWLRCDPDDMFKMHAYSGPAVWDQLPPVLQVCAHAAWSASVHTCSCRAVGGPLLRSSSLS